MASENKKRAFSWDDDAKVTDYTQGVKKLWDNALPTYFPEIIKFDTEGAVIVEQFRSLGPYKISGGGFRFKAKTDLDPSPLKKLGEIPETLTFEEFKKAYGENFDHELKQRMHSLLKYAGIKVSWFDFDGELTYFMENGK